MVEVEIWGRTYCMFGVYTSMRREKTPTDFIFWDNLSPLSVNFLNFWIETRLNVVEKLQKFSFKGIYRSSVQDFRGMYWQKWNTLFIIMF